MEKPYQAMPGVHVLPAFFPVPGMGCLPVNAFVIKAQEPVLVDTGMGIDAEEFMKALASVIDPADLRWVWLTHDDADHTGNLRRVLEAAPRARLVTHALSALRISSAWPLPMDRVYWLNPGESIAAGDRTLTALRPPLFDNPTTIAVHDGKSGALFSADFFGALIPAPANNAAEIADRDMAQGMTGWASADSPWVHLVEPRVFADTLDKIRRMAPAMIFSAHLPPARGMTERFLELLAKVPASPPFAAPNQAALEQILAQARGGS
jgi:flavorubredoxin